ncbi:MAG: SDR family NAD(P)-dependent oxidoreductase [Bacteroidia bacterium]
MAEKKTVLITGGTSGIGYELAKKFAKEGYDLVIVARKEKELQEAATNLKSYESCKVTTVAKDLFNPENAFELYRELREKNLVIDILVNDAGQGHFGPFVETDIDRDLDIIQLNITSLVVLSKLFGKEMADRGDGKILNLSSIASRLPGPNDAIYHGTKAFVQSFSEALHYELKDKGVVVTALLPGATDTDFFRKAGTEYENVSLSKDDMADPADVAKDGYDALMSGKDMIVSGLKNKIQTKQAAITTDQKAAKKMAKENEVVKK